MASEPNNSVQALENTTKAGIMRSPRFWIAVQLLGIVAVGSLFGCWQVERYPDSDSYITTSMMSLEPALRQPRTLGYPMILRFIAIFSPDYRALPWVQLAMLFPVVYFFDGAMRRFGASPWQAFAVSSGFMYGSIQQIWTVAGVLTDFPTTMVAGTAIACLFWIVAQPRQPAAWIGLTFFTAFAYHTRPAYLFVVPLVPCLGLALMYIHSRSVGKPFFWKRMLLALIGAALVPLLAFCTLRLIVVNEFALVSFGGPSAMGMAAELLDSEMIENDLSEPYRPLAREILLGRQERGMKPAFPGGWWVDMRAYEDNYSKNIFFIALPAARKLLGEDKMVLNREFTRFSREVVRLRPGKFLLWAAQYWPRAAMKIAYRYWILWASVPILFLLFVIRRFRCGSCRYSPRELADASWNSSILPAVVCLNVLYAGAAIAVLILSGAYADSRLIVPTAVFLPSLIGLLILQELEMLATGWRLRTRI